MVRTFIEQMSTEECWRLADSAHDEIQRLIADGPEVVHPADMKQACGDLRRTRDLLARKVKHCGPLQKAEKEDAVDQIMRALEVLASEHDCTLHQELLNCMTRTASTSPKSATTRGNGQARLSSSAAHDPTSQRRKTDQTIQQLFAIAEKMSRQRMETDSVHSASTGRKSFSSDESSRKFMLPQNPEGSKLLLPCPETQNEPNKPAMTDVDILEEIADIARDLEAATSKVDFRATARNDQRSVHRLRKVLTRLSDSVASRGLPLGAAGAAAALGAENSFARRSRGPLSPNERQLMADLISSTVQGMMVATEAGAGGEAPAIAEHQADPDSTGGNNEPVVGVLPEAMSHVVAATLGSSSSASQPAQPGTTGNPPALTVERVSQRSGTLDWSLGWAELSADDAPVSPGLAAAPTWADSGVTGIVNAPPLSSLHNRGSYGAEFVVPSVALSPVPEMSEIAPAPNWGQQVPPGRHASSTNYIDPGNPNFGRPMFGKASTVESLAQAVEGHAGQASDRSTALKCAAEALELAATAIAKTRRARA